MPILIFNGTLRARRGGRRVEIFLTEDAQTVTAGASATNRSSRRPFERLVAVGASRELTGRPTFRRGAPRQIPPDRFLIDFDAAGTA